MTTTQTPREPWNDDRLNAAFAARAALAGAPADLADATIEGLRTRQDSVLSWRRLLAPATAAILAIGAVSGAIALRGSSGPPPESSALPAGSEPLAGQNAMGLPTVSVSDALAIRDAGDDDREIAVRGWFSPMSPVSCPYTQATSPVQPVCPDEWILLMSQPESLVTKTANGYSGRLPVGPSIQIDLDDLDTTWQPDLPDAGESRPVDVVVVGHFDDPRSAACPVDQVDACRDRFVVDRVDSVNGTAQPTSAVDDVESVGMSFDDAAHTIEAIRPGASILSAAHVDGGHGLRRMEPAVDGGNSLVQEAAVWAVRVLEAGELKTYGIVDSTGSIYEFTTNGPVLVALSTPGERTSPSASPIPDSPTD